MTVTETTGTPDNPVISPEAFAAIQASRKRKEGRTDTNTTTAAPAASTPKPGAEAPDKKLEPKAPALRPRTERQLPTELREIVADSDTVDGLVAAILTRWYRPGFAGAKIHLVKAAKYDHTKDTLHAARVKGGSVAVDMIVPGLHSIKMRSLQGVFDKPVRDLRGYERGSAARAVAELYAPPDVLEVLRPFLEMIEAYDGKNLALSPWLGTEMPENIERYVALEGLTLIGLCRSLLKGYWLKSQRIQERAQREGRPRPKLFPATRQLMFTLETFLDGCIENGLNEVQRAKLRLEHVHRYGGDSEIQFSESGQVMFTRGLSGPWGDAIRIVAWNRGVLAIVSESEGRTSVTRSRFAGYLSVDTPEIRKIFKGAEAYVEPWYIVGKADKVDFGALLAQVVHHVDEVESARALAALAASKKPKKK